MREKINVLFNVLDFTVYDSNQATELHSTSMKSDSPYCLTPSNPTKKQHLLP